MAADVASHLRRVLTGVPAIKLISLLITDALLIGLIILVRQNHPALGLTILILALNHLPLVLTRRPDPSTPPEHLQPQNRDEELEEALARLHESQDQIIARQKLAEIGTLSAGIAHEIRNPLNIIGNFAVTSKSLVEELVEVLKDDRYSEQERRENIIDITIDLTENMTRIENNCQRASRIIQDVAAMSRESDENSFEEVDLNEMLKEYAALAYQAERARDTDFNVAFTNDFDPEAGTIRCVSKDLSRVFINLVSNACHATRDRNRREGDGYEPLITLATERVDGALVVRIEDNGQGMPPDVVDKIFTPFFTTKTTKEGTGLGLSLSHEIIRHHGGTIDVDSKPGRGTTMRLTFPKENP